MACMAAVQLAHALAPRPSSAEAGAEEAPTAHAVSAAVGAAVGSVAGTMGAVADSLGLRSPLPLPPLLVTFGCPVVGDAPFVALQNALTAPHGGLRVFNHLDAVVSVGHGLLSLASAVGHDTIAPKSHGGLPLALRNDVGRMLNPMANHLTYVCDSFEAFPETPVARARYCLPGLVYQPDADPISMPAATPKRVNLEQAAAALSAPARFVGEEAAPPPRPARTWQERAGREAGTVGYQFGDVTRTVAHWLRGQDGEGAAKSAR
jgi:hypothetical protein